jgi:hypothetical protein
MVESRQLIHFAEIVKKGSFRSAAKELIEYRFFVSQMVQISTLCRIEIALRRPALANVGIDESIRTIGLFES